MFSRRIVAIVGSSLLAIVLTVLAQDTKSRILVQKDSLKVVVDERFPKVLDSEIHIGPNHHPYFRTEGDQTGIKHAEIDIDFRTAVSVVRKETESESYALYFFFEDADKKVVGMFDLNMDGQWDVKKSPTRKRNFIFLDNGWQETEAIDGLLSGKPTAKVGGVLYEFLGMWKSVR